VWCVRGSNIDHPFRERERARERERKREQGFCPVGEEMGWVGGGGLLVRCHTTCPAYTCPAYTRARRSVGSEQCQTIGHALRITLTHTLHTCARTGDRVVCAAACGTEQHDIAKNEAVIHTASSLRIASCSWSRPAGTTLYELCKRQCPRAAEG
jgi:hypothetical protein